MHTYIHTHTLTHTYTHTHIHTHTYIHTYIHIYIHIYRAGIKNEKIIRNFRFLPKNCESLSTLTRNFTVLIKKL